MLPFESGRRLCLLFEAGQGRYAIDATSVAEVAPPSPDGKTIRGTLELRDLSRLFGGAEEERPGMGVVLDVSPTLAARIRRVLEVADVSKDTFFQLPPTLGDFARHVMRGALLHAGKLFLELSAEALPHLSGEAMAAPPRPVYLVDEAPERGLVFLSQGRRFAVALGLVSQIVARGDAFCPLPTSGGPACGVFPHGNALWPVYATSALLGGATAREELLILTELAGQSVALTAQAVEGVWGPFRATGERGEWEGPTGPALCLDFQRMFS